MPLRTGGRIPWPANRYVAKVENAAWTRLARGIAASQAIAIRNARSMHQSRDVAMWGRLRRALAVAAVVAAD